MPLELTKRIQDRRTPYYSQDVEWVLFVKDHRSEILKNSAQYFITYNDQNTYKYRLYSYLVETNINVELLWIILWLNQLDTEMDFVNVDSLFIPSDKYIGELYQQYRSCKSKFNKESK